MCAKLTIDQARERVRHVHPDVAGDLGFSKDRLQPLEKIVAVGVLPKNPTALDATSHDMVQGTRGVHAGSKRHG
jgi:hypothetical protein